MPGKIDSFATDFNDYMHHSNGYVTRNVGPRRWRRSQAPMATVVVFGRTISTLVTLVLVPVMYTIIHDFRERLHRFLYKKTSSEVEANQIVTG